MNTLQRLIRWAYWPSTPLGATLPLVSRFKQRYTRPAPKVLLCAMPKSGSTFLSKLLTDATGFQYGIIAESVKGTEQDLFEPRLADWYNYPYVVQQHISPNRHNQQMIQRYGLRPTVLLRSIPDVVVSLREHLLREGSGFPFLDLQAVPFSQLAASDQYHYICQFAGPWLVNFYAGWKQIHERQVLPCQLLYYEDMLADKAQFAAQIAQYYQLAVDKLTLAQRIQQLETHQRNPKHNVQDGGIRLSEGIAGRGKQLPPDCLASLQSLTRYYPNTDFSRSGLEGH